MSVKTQPAFSYLDQTIAHFREVTKGYALFHTLFFSLFIVELLVLLIFLPLLAKSFLLAATVALTVLTGFAYFVLRFYFQTKKPEQFLAMREDFLQKIQHHLPMEAAPHQARQGTLQALRQFIQTLEGQEFDYYSLPTSLQTVQPLVRKFSVWCHWEDLHLMKELLYISCIQILIQAIKEHPTDLDLHAMLATTYTYFYKIYQTPSHEESYPFMAREYASLKMREAMQKYARLAMEELKIILHFRPQDSWALSQLGSIYHDLDQKEEEKKIYEHLLQISPQESAIRYRLGMLYFQLGLMAEGLKVYDELLKASDSRARELIKHYDLFQ